jgi:hypothetical protein
LIRVDDSHLTGTNLPVNTSERGRRRKVTRSERATQEALTGSNMFMYNSTLFNWRAQPGDTVIKLTF